MLCKVCQYQLESIQYKIKELHLGLREEFIYYRCNNCGILQLAEIPEHLSRYYPPSQYYSFQSEEKKIQTDILRKWKAQYLLFNKNKIVGKILSTGYKKPDYFEWLKEAGVQFDDSILDVGTGSGSLLISLAKNGFTKLKGIDPFNEKDLNYGKFTVEKKDLFQIKGSYDFIMLNHVFEHMDEPQRTMDQLYNLISPGKYVLIRTPIMGNRLWEIYRESWMQLDAPRHL